MARRPNCRRVGCIPRSKCFKPAGIPVSDLEQLNLTVDEFEAIRLADLQGLYQDQAAEEMNVSRQTFGRIIESARRKIAQALVEVKALVIEGGDIEMCDSREFKCYSCQHTWNVPFGICRPTECPECKSEDLHRTGTDCGTGRACHRHGQQHARGRGVCKGRPAGG